MTKNNRNRKPFLHGTGVAMVTPFKKNGAIDYASIDKLYHHLVEGGVDYLVPLGTTGEAATLTIQERQEILEYLIDINKENIPIVVGIGGNSTAEVIEQFKLFPLEKVDAILSVSPYYNKPSQKGLYEHYATLAKNTSKPILLYNVPGRTSKNIHYETTIKLSNIPNIVAIKEASGDLEQTMYINKYSEKSFLIISGDDNMSTALFTAGSKGTISVIANAYPKMFSKMINSALESNFHEATKIQLELLDITNLIFAENNPSGIKYILSKLGIIENNLRLPLVPLSKEVSLKMDSFIEKNALL